jgi:hypothetical protein
MKKHFSPNCTVSEIQRASASKQQSITPRSNTKTGSQFVTPSLVSTQPPAVCSTSLLANYSDIPT